MDYIFEYLENPVEAEDIIYSNSQPKANHPAPDSYRQYLFNNADFQLTGLCALSNQLKATMTNTDQKYWDINIDELINYIIDLAYVKYKNLPYHCIIDYLDLECNLDNEIIKYYDHLYDMCDVIIARSFESRCSVLPNNMLKNLMEPNIQKNYPVIRIIFYFSYYFIFEQKYGKFTMSCNINSFVKTSINKAIEFQSSSDFKIYNLTAKELGNYISNPLYDSFLKRDSTNNQ